MLEIKNLSKIYTNKNKKTIALDNLSFSLNSGEKLGLIGPNGSGKTTLIKMLTQISYPSQGEIFLDKFPLDLKHKGLFGLMLGNSLLYNRLTARQNLLYYAALYNVKNADQKILAWAKKLGFEQYLDLFLEFLSEGNKAKVAFCRAVIHNPKILILDEPTSNIDPAASNEIKKQIKEFKTVIFSSHNLADIEEIAEKVLILKKGKNVFYDTMNKLKEKEHFVKNPDKFVKKYYENF